ncbi:hypothetical protein HNP40_001753 [Mycobacteroides chelonae]|nr:hypothetical protein [Mycobacteroides chelonae]
MKERIRVGIQLRPAEAQNWPAFAVGSNGVVLDSVQPEVNNFEAPRPLQSPSAHMPGTLVYR